MTVEDRAFRVLALDHTPHVGGAEAALLAAFAAPVDRSWRCAIAAPGGGALERGARARGIPFRPTPIDRLGLLRPLGSRMALDAVARVIDEARPDVILANGVRSLKACLALGPSGPPLVAFVHDVIEPRTASRAMRAFGLFQWRVRAFVVPAEAAAAALAAAGIEAQRIRVAPPAVETAGPLSVEARAAALCAVGIDPERTVVGFVGQIEPRKGVDVLLEALALRSVPADVEVLVVGDDPFGEHHVNRGRILDRARMTPAVRITGWRHDAATLAAALDVLVCPSRGDACPLVILEAMAAGVPVVASRVGGIPEQLGRDEAGWLVPAGDAAALRDAIDAALREPRERHIRGEAGRARHAERFSVARARAALFDALHAAIEGDVGLSREGARP